MSIFCEIKETVQYRLNKNFPQHRKLIITSCGRKKYNFTYFEKNNYFSL